MCSSYTDNYMATTYELDNFMCIENVKINLLLAVHVELQKLQYVMMNEIKNLWEAINRPVEVIKTIKINGVRRPQNNQNVRVNMVTDLYGQSESAMDEFTIQTINVSISRT